MVYLYLDVFVMELTSLYQLQCHLSSADLSKITCYLPRPQIQLLHKKISHHSFHMTKTSIKGDSVVCESFNKTTFVFLAKEAQNESFLTRLDYSVGSVHQDA